KAPGVRGEESVGAARRRHGDAMLPRGTERALHAGDALLVWLTRSLAQLAKSMSTYLLVGARGTAGREGPAAPSRFRNFLSRRFALAGGSGLSEIGRAEIETVREVIRPYVRVTPVVQVSGKDFGLGDFAIALKLELLQHSGSFKARGAFTNLLLRKIPPTGGVAAARGHHGAAQGGGRLRGARVGADADGGAQGRSPRRRAGGRHCRRLTGAPQGRRADVPDRAGPRGQGAARERRRDPPGAERPLEHGENRGRA